MALDAWLTLLHAAQQVSTRPWLGALKRCGSVEALIAAAAGGHLDAVVHNAALCPPVDTASLSDADLEATLAVNIRAPHVLTAALAPAMLVRGSGAIVVVGTLADAIPLCDRLAPEHLQLAVDDPQHLFDRVRHAGSVFMGRHTPEAIGDYIGGPNHVLPTARTARFSSGLSVMDFLKRTTVSRMTPAALAALGPHAETLAKAERLEAHGMSVRARLDRING